jgi:hypothetical protein
LFYPKAMQHIFVGLYIQQIVLCALFFLSGGTIGVVLGVLMIVLIVLTVSPASNAFFPSITSLINLCALKAGFNAILNHSYSPLISALPLTLQAKTHTQPIDPIHGGEPAEASLAAQKPLPLGPADKPRDEESAERLRAGKGAADGADDQDNIEEERRNKEEGSKNALTTLAQQQDEEETYGFYHPAASRPQRTVWLPEDEFGVSQAEEKGCEEAGVTVSSANALVKIVDRKKGKVKVSVRGGPPDLIGVVI